MKKINDVIGLLTQGWQPAEEICHRFGWKNHTLRGALSVYGRKHNIKIERQRVNKITSYRIAGDVPYDAENDFAKSIDVAYDHIRKRKAAGGPDWEPPQVKD